MEDAALDEHIVTAIFGGNAEAASKAERIGEGGTLDHGNETAAGQLFHGLEVVELADGDVHVARAVFDQRVGDIDLVSGEIDLHLVGKAAGDIALYTQTRSARFRAPAFVTGEAVGE